MGRRFLKIDASRAFDVIAAAEGASTLLQLEASAGAALRRYGFDVVTAVEIGRRDGQRSIAPLFGDMEAAPLLHYLERGHSAHCPVVATASSEPAVWSEIRARPLQNRQRLVLDELGSFALNDGHILAVRRGRNLPVAISAAGAKVALDDPVDRMAVHFLSTHYGLIGARLAQPAHVGSRLSPRQLECLEWVREGKSSFDIGEILGISARTVDQHLLTACQRLGVKTRFQAVVEASLYGAISL
jgi:DNA-binding CsgD family transcriptional regulator